MSSLASSFARAEVPEQRCGEGASFKLGRIMDISALNPQITFKV